MFCAAVLLCAACLGRPPPAESVTDSEWSSANMCHSVYSRLDLSGDQWSTAQLMRALCTVLLILAPLAARAQGTSAQGTLAQQAASQPPPTPPSLVPPTQKPARVSPAGAPPAKTPPPSADAQSPSSPSDDFDLLPKEKLVDSARVAEIERKATLRRSMLQLHQLGGFLTLGALSVTVISGQLNYHDKYGGGGDTGRYRSLHQISAYGSAAIFAATGLLAVLAPNTSDKPVRLDTATLHKILVSIATAAMLSEVVLGPLTSGAEGSLRQRDLALAHQIIGYTALATTAAGFLVLTF